MRWLISACVGSLPGSFLAWSKEGGGLNSFLPALLPLIVLSIVGIAAAWEAARATGAIDLATRAGVRLAATNATLAAAQAVDRMYNAGGGTSVYATSPLQRCFRDVHVVTQHLMVAPATYELTGRLLFGLATDAALL